MSFKEKHEEFLKAQKEYRDKVNLWFKNHECNNTCSLYKYHLIDKTALNNATCEYIAEKYVNEVADTIEKWYKDYLSINNPKNKFYKWLNIGSTSSLPWQNFDSECDNCSSKLPCNDCCWWDEGVIKEV